MEGISTMEEVEAGQKDLEFIKTMVERIRQTCATVVIEMGVVGAPGTRSMIEQSLMVVIGDLVAISPNRSDEMKKLHEFLDRVVGVAGKIVVPPPGVH